MADEPENHTLALLREMRAEMREGFEKLRAEAAVIKAENCPGDGLDGEAMQKR
jgi:hypothetical protein